MRKFISSTASLLLLMVFAMTSLVAKAQTQVVFGQKYEVASFAGFEGTISIPGPGTLTVLEAGGLGGTLYTPSGSEAQQEGLPNYTNDGTEFIYNVVPGTYKYEVGWNVDPGSLTFTFEGGDDSGDDGPVTPPTDLPAGCVEMPMNQTISITGVITGDVETGFTVPLGAAFYYFTAPDYGTLYITQTGSLESHLHFVPNLTGDEVPTETPAESETNNGTLKYDLVKGKTYYFMAKAGSYDSINSAMFEWEPYENTGDENEITEGQVASIPSGAVYSYTPDESGVLTIETSQYTTGLATPPQTQYFFFSDPVCQALVPCVSVGDGATLNGYSATFEVTAGTTYYVKNPIGGNVDFLFLLDAGKLVEAVLKNIQTPSGNMTVDPTAQESTFSLLFEPAGVTIGSVDVIYTNKNTNQVVTLPLINDGSDLTWFVGGDAWQIATPNHITPEGRRENANESNTLLPILGGDGVTYVLHDVAYNGQPVLYSNVTEGVTVDNGTITITFTLGEAPTLVSESWPAALYKEYTPGDPAGIATLTYSQPLGNLNYPEVSVIEGRQFLGGTPSGEFESFTVDSKYVTINGNQLIIDFTHQTWNCSTTTVTVDVKGVVSESGLLASYGGDAEYMYYLPFNAATAPEPDVKPELPIISYIEPKAGEQPGLFDGETITITIDSDVKEEFTSVVGKLYDAEGEFWSMFEFTKNVAGNWVYDLGWDYVFYAPNTYDFVVSLYNGSNLDDANIVGQQTITWIGTTEAPASITCTVDPANGSTIVPVGDDVTVVVTFSAPVANVTAEIPAGQGIGNPVEIVANADKTVWTAFAPLADVEQCIKDYSEFRLTFYPVDAEGNAIYVDGSTNISLSYNVDMVVESGRDFNVDIEGETVTGPVEYFTVSAPGGISANDFNNTLEINGEWVSVNQFQAITISNAEGTVVSGVEPVDTTGESDEETGDFTPAEFNGVVTLTTPITVAGEYSIHFPFGAFTIGEEMDSEMSMEKTVIFTVSAAEENDEPRLVNPSVDGLSALSAMQVVWADDAVLTYPEGKSNVEATLTTPEGVDNVTGRIAWWEKAEENTPGGAFVMPLAEGDNSVLFQFDPVYNTPGTYTLTIPANSVLVNGVANSEAILFYDVQQPLETMGYAQLDTPERQFVASCLSATLTWDRQAITLAEDANISVKVDMNTYEMDELDVELTTINEDASNEPGIMTLADDEDVKNALRIELPFEVFGMTGEYQFIIPEGTVINADGKVNPMQIVSIYVLPVAEELLEVELTVTPECANYESATVKTLDVITLNWGGYEIATNEPCGVRLDCGETQNDLMEDGLLSIDEDGATVLLSVASLTQEAGEYNLVVPEAAFLIGDETNLSVNNEYYFTYIVTENSGIINFVDAQDGKYVVYNVNGILVLDTENASDLNGLQPGLYIINGKKVYVRK